MKRCGKPAAWTLKTEPGKALTFCSRHLPKKFVKLMGLDFRKALPGETCGQSAFVEAALTAQKKELKKTNDEGKALNVYLDILTRDKKLPVKKKPMISNG